MSRVLTPGKAVGWTNLRQSSLREHNRERRNMRKRRSMISAEQRDTPRSKFWTRSASCSSPDRKSRPEYRMHPRFITPEVESRFPVDLPCLTPTAVR